MTETEKLARVKFASISESKAEKLTHNFLQANSIAFEAQKGIDWDGRFSVCDFYLPQLNTYLEVDDYSHKHPNKYTMDVARDRWLIANKSVSTIRINSNDATNGFIQLKKALKLLTDKPKAINYNGWCDVWENIDFTSTKTVRNSVLFATIHHPKNHLFKYRECDRRQFGLFFKIQDVSLQDLEQMIYIMESKGCNVCEHSNKYETEYYRNYDTDIIYFIKG